MSFISIVTICLNSEQTIEKTIKSIVSQLTSKDEYFIIDGGSTDGTLDIVEKYSSHVTNCISEKDDGISSAFNKGIALCSREIIGLINSDDWLEEGSIKRVRDLFNSSNVDIIYSDIIFWNNSKSALIKHSDHRKLGSIFRGSSVWHPTTFVKRNLYERIGKYSDEYKLRMDYDFFIRAKKNNAIFIKSKVPLTNYRKGGASTLNPANCVIEEASIIKRAAIFSKIYVLVYSIVRMLIMLIMKPLREIICSIFQQ